MRPTRSFTQVLVPKIVHFQYKIKQTITINYVYPLLGIGLVNWQQAWDISGTYPQPLYTEIYKGNLVFRKKGRSKRISYKQLKKGLIKKEMVLQAEPVPL